MEKIDAKEQAHACKQASVAQEERVAKLWGGKRTPQSGGGKWRKGDVLTNDVLIEAKTSITEKACYSVKQSILDKANKQRSEMSRRFYVQAFTFGDDRDFYILPENTTKWLLGFREELERVLNDLVSYRTQNSSDRQEAIKKGLWTEQQQQQYQKTERWLSNQIEQLSQQV